MKLHLLFFLFVGLTPLAGQAYQDYIGAGHASGISVSSSSELSGENNWQKAEGALTVNGEGLDASMMEAARFLSQATFGPNADMIREVHEMGMDAWLEDQFAKEATFLLPELIHVYETALEIYTNGGGNPVNYVERPEWEHFDYAWWQVNLTCEDVLRQKVAYALSQILVISAQSSLFDTGEALADYYDLLIEHAFGNYKDLLMEVTLHPSMGVYLSHMNNPREIPEENIHPDENYAREVMQLFSIGLFELNPDGSRKKDGQGKDIPTYDNEDIKQLARVFTGLGAGGTIAKDDVLLPQFNLGLNTVDYTVPMKMYEEWHEGGEKVLIGGEVIPAGQGGMTDIEQAIEHLFNHPNVGPFIGRQLIQRLVKSNPSPDYIERISSVFDDNGLGVRGDMKSVVKAILTDPEARTCAWLNDPENGRLREPITRYTHFVQAVGKENDAQLYWNIGQPYMEEVGQHPLHSLTVFNFYLPDFQPNGPIAEQDLYAPEFQIHNTKTSIGYWNRVNDWAVRGELLYTFEEESFLTTPDYSELLKHAAYPDALINQLDVLLTHGQLSEETREIIRKAIEPFSVNPVGNLFRLRMALYLFMISPDYTVLR
jgi:uncharacterized protein (DUF1800 family)